MKALSKRFAAREYAMAFIGQWYKWGGDDPSGFDCSGFVIEILQAVGVLPRNYDDTAEGLWRKFEENEVAAPALGCLVFYGNHTKMTHVEFCLNHYLSIGASGGGSKTLTPSDAIRDNAFIKVRPIFSRGSFQGIVDPFV